jgi:hypothetical protein
MDRDELPGYEFDVPPGPRHVSGRRPELERDPAPFPEFGRDVGPRPEFGQDPVRRPEFGRDPAPFPEFGRDVGPRSEFGQDLVRRPEFGQDLVRRPEFGQDLAGRPEFGQDVARRSDFIDYGRDSIRGLREQPPEPSPGASVRAAGSGVFDVMRKRNWVMGLAVPIIAAVAVGIAVVVATGGGGTGAATPSALAAGFAPARVAGASFTGSAGTARVALTAIGASGATEVAAGGLDGGPALWTSPDGGTNWTRAPLNGQVGTGQFAGVAHGPAGWLAVGTAGGRPLVASSANAATWTAETGLGQGNAAAAAAGSAGYVVVGHQTANGSSTAVAWYSSSLAGLRAAAITVADDDNEAQAMNSVTVGGDGFIAVGETGTNPAAWLSTTGRTWQQVQVPAPAGADRSALDYVAANGGEVVAAGTEFSATGMSSPFAEVSASGGATWTEIQLPVPSLSTGTGTTSLASAASATVTALTAAGGGFTAAGTYVTKAGPEVLIWTLAPGAEVTDGAAWTEEAPQGTGLGSDTAMNTLTALTVDGASLTGVGFTATVSAPDTQRPTLWQSPIRY